MEKLLILCYGILPVSMSSCNPTKSQKINSCRKSILGELHQGTLSGSRADELHSGTEIEEGKCQNFYTAIDGIDYKSGNIYRIKVNVA